MGFETSLTIDVDTRGAETALTRFDHKLKTTGTSSVRTTKKMEGSFDRLKRSVVSLKGAFGVLVAGAFLRKLVQVGSTFEQLRIQLKTVTGSAALAEKEFTRIKQLAIDTPFEVENLTNAFIRLKSIGVEPTTELLKAFGDVAAGLGRDVTDFTRAAVGAAFGETEALKSFGIAAKVEGEKIAFTFKGITRVVDRNVDSVIGALQKIGQENFAGAANAQVNSFKGAMSNLADATSQFLDQLARTGILSTFSDMIRLLTTGVEGLGDALSSLTGGEQDLSIGGLTTQLAGLEAQYKALKANADFLGDTPGAKILDLSRALLPFVDSLGELETKIFGVKQQLADAQGGGAAVIPPTPGRVKGEKFAVDAVTSLKDENAELALRIKYFDETEGALNAIIAGRNIDIAVREGALEMTEKERGAIVSLQVEQARSADLLKDLASGKQIFEENLTPLQEYNKEMEELNRLMDVGAITSATFNQAQQKTTEAFIAADPVLTKIEGGLHGFSDSLVDAAAQGESFADAMKNTFKSLATDILKELNRVLISKAFASIIGGGAGGGGGFGSIFSSIGSFFGGGTDAELYGNAGFSPSFADGGVHSGGMRLVGENGPELEATGPSRIFNASQTKNMLSGGSGGGGTVINIDARGSNGDAAVTAAVEAGIRRAAPSLINASVNRVKDERSRDPDFFGRGAVA